jgi:hypothetical protein
LRQERSHTVNRCALMGKCGQPKLGVALKFFHMVNFVPRGLDELIKKHILFV